ncbi:helix-turn-helix transcriptional regulator [Ramlibacter tataouinensis]|uniref:helix-turn-helix transcriptional regulator n=1 Tax=Ramlibacter tataouinensis TaxID=94132 RepID=UPI001D12CA7F|nr:response regulator transcription factor [Ramlibacter tataouinensis]
MQTEHPLMELLGTGCDIDVALAALAKEEPDVIVVAVESPADLPRFADLHSKCSAKLLVVTGSQDTALLDQLVLAGARGVVRTSDPPAALIKAIEKVNAGELWIDRSATSRIFMEMARQKAADANDPEKSKIATLTTRERQTIAAVAGDASAPAKVIARRLCISEHTLRNHLTSIYSKLELTSRLDLYAYATRHQLTETGR